MLQTIYTKTIWEMALLKDCYETAHLRLLPCQEALAPGVLDYYQRNRAYLQPYESARDESFFTLGYQRRYLAEEAGRTRTGSAARLYLSPKQPGPQVIGLVALCNIVYSSLCSAWLAYNLDPNWGGQGLMHEALGQMVEIAFGELGLHRLEAHVMPGNLRSLNAVKRLGFTNEGLARQFFEINGRWEDHIRMALNNTAMLPPGGTR